MQEALQMLAADTSYLKVFGSYPARTTKESRAAEPRFNPARERSGGSPG